MEADPLRLQATVKPLKYQLELTPNFSLLTFIGQESILLEIKEETAIINLNVKEIPISSASINKLQAKIMYHEATQTASLTFPQKLPKGKATLQLHFKGKVREDLRGFYKSIYLLPDGTKKTLLTTQFEPVDARSCFPCFDEPALKAIFEVTLNIPKELQALSNMPIKKETIEGMIKKVQFQETPIMSTYLLAMIIGEFEYVEKKTKQGTPVRIFTTPGKKELGNFALEVAVKSLEYYEQYFDIPYPLPKLDLIAIPDFEVGAMENWGLITYRETALLIDEKNSSAASKQTVAVVVAHEIAHQWFGNLVTMQWWNDLWLNEGFASWMEYKAVDNIFPSWDLWTQFYRQEIAPAMSLDGLESSHPIEVEVINPDEIGEIFDLVSYNKGAAIIRMLEQYLSPEIFRKGLHHYFKKFHYKNATTKDLWLSLEETSKKPVQQMMDTWTKQTGYPIVSITTNKDGWKLEQERFLYTKKKDNTLWHIPLALRKEKEETYLDMKIKIIEMKGDQNAIINSSQVGFYRVKYDESLFQQKVKAIKNLQTLDKLGFLGDTYALTRACYYKATDFLTLAQAYQNERDYTIWGEIAGNIGLLQFLFAQSSFAQSLDQYTIKLCAKIFNVIGWEEKKEEPHTTTLLRMVVLSTLGSSNQQEILEEAQQRFSKHLQQKKLNPNLRGVVYALAAWSGNKETYQQLLSLYRESPLQEEKVRVLAALSSFQQEAILKEVLAFNLSKEVRTQDTPIGISRVASNSYGQELTWKFFQEQWLEFKRRYGETGNTMGNLIKAICSRFSSLEKYQEVKKFFQEHPMPAAKKAIEQSLETIQMNANFVKHNKQELADFFKK